MSSYSIKKGLIMGEGGGGVAGLKTQPSGLAFTVKIPGLAPSVFGLQKLVPRT